ncbi:DUF2118 domain-containing protein [Methanocaldococcus indicus]|uniref:DUF2118 domain-containing protein n=1 Tax=Methanocaldococcus indicus TaxID=213231 RepID=UPI003C6CE168
MKFPELYVENPKKHENKRVVIERDGKIIKFLDENEDYKGDGKVLYKIIYDDFPNYILMNELLSDILLYYEVGGAKQIIYLKKGTKLLEIMAEGYKVYPIVDFGCRILENHRLAAIQTGKGEIRFVNTPVTGLVIFLEEIPTKSGRENYKFYILPDKEIEV